jgi:hypothetical protein
MLTRHFLACRPETLREYWVSNVRLEGAPVEKPAGHVSKVRVRSESQHGNGADLRPDESRSSERVDTRPHETWQLSLRSC